MESSLHSALKELIVAGSGRTEVRIGRWRVDGLVAGTVVEIQTGPLVAVRQKVNVLLREYPVLLIKPIVVRKTLRWFDPTGNFLRQRNVDKVEHLTRPFDDLVYFTRIFPHPQLTIRLLYVWVAEDRLSPQYLPRDCRSRRHAVIDVKLLRVEDQIDLRKAGDLLRLLPAQVPPELDTASLAQVLNVPVWEARKIIYCLRECGALRQIGCRRRFRVYAVSTPEPPANRFTSQEAA